MALVDTILDKLSDPADDLVFLDHAAEILEKRGHITASRAVAAIARYERTRGKEVAEDRSEHGAQGGVKSGALGAKQGKTKRPAHVR